MRQYKIIIITGLSGSGKSVALAALEDAGFYCVDNMPVLLLPKFLDLPMHQDADFAGFAFVMDLREKGFTESFPGIYKNLLEKGANIEIWFLEANPDILIRRYSQTRRHHPLAISGRPLPAAIHDEIKLLEPLKNMADQVIDSSETTVHELKVRIKALAEKFRPSKSMLIHVLSFGFKNGLPREADLVIDVRFLPNPFFVPDLREKDGREDEIKEFVFGHDVTKTFLSKFYDFLDFLIPFYQKEGKAYLTVAIGCTGGRHRSVVIAEAVFTHIRERGMEAALIHRDIERN